MPQPKPLALAVGAALVLAGCGSMPAQDSRMRVEPHQEVTGSRLAGGRIDYDAAIAAYREKLRKDPLSVETYNRLGIALATQGRFNEAIREFQAAVTLEPNRAHLHNNLGYAYLLRGDDVLAAAALERAVALDPNHPKAGKNLAVVRSRLAGKAPPRARPEPDTRPISAQPLAPLSRARPDAGIDLVAVAPQVYELRGVPVNLPVNDERPPMALREYRLEISNGNGVNGMARRVSGHLGRAGVPTARLTNQRPFDQRATEIQYRKGYEAEAARLAEALQVAVPREPSARLRGDIHVRLVLGRDVLKDTALVRPAYDTRNLAAREKATTPG